MSPEIDKKIDPEEGVVEEEAKAEMTTEEPEARSPSDI